MVTAAGRKLRNDQESKGVDVDLIGGAAALLIAGSGWYTDLLWFQACYEGVWRSILTGEVRLPGLAALFMFLNLSFSGGDGTGPRSTGAACRRYHYRSSPSVRLISIILGFCIPPLRTELEAVLGFGMPAFNRPPSLAGTQTLRV